MIDINQLFVIIVGGVFGLGFLGLGIFMLFDKHPRNKIRKPPIWLKKNDE